MKPLSEKLRSLGVPPDLVAEAERLEQQLAAVRDIVNEPAPKPAPQPSKIYEPTVQVYQGYRRRRGRPPATDWAAVEIKVFDLMRARGPFTGRANGWNQARLTDELLVFTATPEGDEVGVTTIREKLPGMLERYYAQHGR